MAEHLASPAQRRVAVRPTPAGLRAIRSGDPWLFDGSISAADPADLPPGATAVLFDGKRVAGVGLWDPNSPIRVKVLGGNGQLQVGPALWEQRLAAALHRRFELDRDPQTTAWRWVHGENDGLPGLVVDRYGEVVVLKIYSDIWFVHLDDIVSVIASMVDPSCIVFRSARRVTSPSGGPRDGDTIFGELPSGALTYLEKGLVFGVDVVAGNKTGAFLDQRDNRWLIRSHSDGARVLDVFTATGGFAVSAAAGGAKSVHMVDISQPALNVAVENMRRNRQIPEVRRCEVTSQCGDAFVVLDDLIDQRRTFDLVIIDPPSFAQNERSVPGALAAYRRLARAGLRLTAPGGLFVQASCSSRVDVEQLAEVLRQASREVRRNFREVRRTAHAIDHPVGFTRGAYLKALYAAVATSD